jgi:hypothetical protein
VQTSAEAATHGYACRVSLALLCAVAACGGNARPAPAAVGTGSPTHRDGGTAKDAAVDAASPHVAKDAGTRFGFGAFAVDASAGSPTQSTDSGTPTVPAGWQCRPELARDRVCDCGCGAPDGACATPSCTTPGCSLPVCAACFDVDGENRDCGAPGAWLCERARRSDGVCDCGCGALDPDCAGAGGCYQTDCNVEGCELCHGPGGSVECPKPAAFRCSKAVRGDGVCDCGCGNYDPDCKQSACTDAGCYASGCEVCHDQRGRAIACQPPAADWACDAAQRGDGVCDCGCGQDDPDCPKDGACTQPGCSASACEQCHDTFGRLVPCPGLWTCGAARFADGRSCDCGCGRADPDCAGAGCAEAQCQASACDVRHDQTGRALAPASWTCAASAYGRGDGCDCGCGSADPDCTVGCVEPGCRAPACDHCRLANGTGFDCRWSCELARYGSGGSCDCGCGAFDPDCAGLGCYAPGCYADGCAHCFDSKGAENACQRGACAAGYQNDGVCDCGCRQDDPDCLTGNTCVEPGCSADGCARCHDTAGASASCSDWVCGLELQGGHDGCNCGCGALDPDCATGQGCAEAGCFTSGCVTCRSADGAPMSCAP